MCLAHSGIASGDQSLNEFISLKGSMPYYDVQPWKQDLAKGLQKFWPENKRANMTDHKMLGANMEGRYITSLFLPNKNRPEPSLDQLAKKTEIEMILSYILRINE
ncbi:hypothetical protein M2263_003290 [Providencia alcalifaciens]|nr:hypothetical protein [Providencia alcalifaciens]